MKLRQYPAYKHSGVEWLSMVPSHWAIRPVKRLANLTTGMTPPTDAYENYDEEGFPWIRPEDIDESGAVTCASKFLSATGKKIARIAAPYSSLICCIGTIGKVGIIDQASATNQQITAAFFHGSAKYFYFTTIAARNEMETSATGNVIKIINTERLGRIVYPVPPNSDQVSIAAFLDFETAKIDRLIDKQRQLIALLKEKRQAVISHAVTKGLNPDAPMKDSGVEWLGEVPAHWRSACLKFFISVQGGYAFKSELLGAEGTPVIRIGDIRKTGRVEVSGCKRVPTNFTGSLTAFRVISGDILMAMTGATIGKAGRVPKGEMALLNQRVGAFRPKSDELRYEFLWHVLATEAYQEHVWLTADGGAQPNISDKGMLDYRIALPPLEEQDRISRYLARRLPVIDALDRKASDQIELLQERRTALISAAVTGKIDVRNWTHPSNTDDAQEVA